MCEAHGGLGRLDVIDMRRHAVGNTPVGELFCLRAIKGKPCQETRQ